MTAPLRLGAFALVLAVAFVAAAAIGRAVGPLEREVDKAHTEEAEDLAVEVVRKGPALAFRIVGADDFDVLHERRMHLIVVRRDLSRFQHLHPRLNDGVWRTPLRLPEAGTYVAFADFSTAGRRATLPFDLHVAGRYEPRPLPAPSTVSTVDEYRVTLRRSGERLEFDVRRDGRAVRIDPYLGARGHLVALRVADLAYLHTHAEQDELAFETAFPSAGRYRLFLQFRAGGAVRTAAFTLEVSA